MLCSSVKQWYHFGSWPPTAACTQQKKVLYTPGHQHQLLFMERARNEFECAVQGSWIDAFHFVKCMFSGSNNSSASRQQMEVVVFHSATVSDTLPCTLPSPLSFLLSPLFLLDLSCKPDKSTQYHPSRQINPGGSSGHVPILHYNYPLSFGWETIHHCNVATKFISKAQPNMFYFQLIWLATNRFPAALVCTVSSMT